MSLETYDPDNAAPVTMTDATPSAKEESRKTIEIQVQEFLNRGGKITHIDYKVPDYDRTETD